MFRPLSGRKQLERLPQLVSRRRALAAGYAELLADIEGLGLPVEPEWARSNWQSYCVRLPDRVDQKAVMQGLLDQGICHATWHHVLAPRGAVFRRGKQRHDLHQSELAQEHCILLPIYTQMTEDNLVQIADALRKQVAGDRRRTGLRIGEKIGG